MVKDGGGKGAGEGGDEVVGEDCEDGGGGQGFSEE